MSSYASKFRTAAATVVLLPLIAGATASLLPLIETNVWWIRFLDFPRLQIAVATTVLLVVFLGLRRRPRRIEWVAVIAAVAAISYQIYKLYPYTSLLTPMAVAQETCPEGQGLVVMVANVKRDNDRTQAFLDLVDGIAPDLLLVMETDASWDARLAPLDADFPHAVQNIPKADSHFGMHLFSRLELVSSEFRFIAGSDTPSVVARLRLGSGAVVAFIGLHPRPPLGWSQPTTMRDAHLLSAGIMAREFDVPTMVAGDFNVVPWERATRRAMRIGGLLDPRVGRGFMPTYSTVSRLISWPLDHVLFQEQFVLQDFGVLPDFGSDHNAVVARLCHDPEAEQAPPTLLPDDLSEALTSIDAAQRM